LTIGWHNLCHHGFFKRKLNSNMETIWNDKLAHTHTV
jgi:hypothetical protein